MWTICKKEWSQFFSSLAGYISIAVFLLLNGLLFFVFPKTSLLDYGYATLQPFFETAPWVLLFLIPTITMRSFAEEFKTGTFETLKTMPLSSSQLVWGKFLGTLLIAVLAIVPTVVYAFSLQALSAAGGIDVGATIGSFIGLIMLGAVFTAVGICASSFTNNTIVAFISGAFVCLILYAGFDAIASLPIFKNGLDYYLQMPGINFHYLNISRGVVDIRDIIYFLGIIFLFLFITQKNIEKK